MDSSERFDESPLADRSSRSFRGKAGSRSIRPRRYVPPPPPEEEDCSCEETSTSGGGFFSITWLGISLWVWIIIILVIIALIILLLWWYGYFSKTEEPEKKKKTLPQNPQDSPDVESMRRNLPRPVRQE